MSDLQVFIQFLTACVAAAALGLAILNRPAALQQKLFERHLSDLNLLLEKASSAFSLAMDFASSPTTNVDRSREQCVKAQKAAREFSDLSEKQLASSPGPVLGACAELNSALAEIIDATMQICGEREGDMRWMDVEGLRKTCHKKYEQLVQNARLSLGTDVLHTQVLGMLGYRINYSYRQR